MILTREIQIVMIDREVTYGTADTSDDDSIEDWSDCFHMYRKVSGIHYRGSKN